MTLRLMSGRRHRSHGLSREAAFIAWTPRERGSRSRSLARELGIGVHFFSATSRRGLIGAPYKYVVQTLGTIAFLVKRRPEMVFVQSPPSLAAMIVATYALLTRARFAVDAHSDAMLSPYWTRPRWLIRWLARQAAVTIVTNEHFAETIRSWGARAIVIPDIPATFSDGTFDVADHFNIAVVNTFAADEPLEEVLAAARDLDGVKFFITGDGRRAPERVPANSPPNVEFTQFLSESDYYGLLRSSDAVMCLTTRDHTMQRGACEALWLGKPIITSDWPILQEYFAEGTLHVANTAAGIRSGVLEMRRDHAKLQRGIAALQTRRRQTWEESSLPSLQALLLMRSQVEGKHVGS